MVTVTALRIADVKRVAPRVHADARGHLYEAWNARALGAAGLPGEFVQDNCVRSGRGVLRGLHYQLRRPQGKLVRVVHGEVFDVAVDLRRTSPTFGQWVGERLSSETYDALWIPPGFAHGYLVISELADVYYKCTGYYDAPDDRCLRWDDPDLRIAWPLDGIDAPLVSARDAAAPLLANAETYS